MGKEVDANVLKIYELKKLLGSGAYGYVWKVVQRHSGRVLALKKVFGAFQNATDAQRTYREVTILLQLDHPNIIRLDRVISASNDRDLYLVFEHMQADVHSLVGSKAISNIHLRYIVFQILIALQYLHSAQLLHRDLKPSNLLINSDCHIKLCDFGLARSLTHLEDQNVVLSQDVATRWYRSPEMLLGSRQYSKPTDIWSVGCILAELLAGKPLFPGTSTLNQLERILEFTGLPSKQTVDALQSDLAESLINQLSVEKKRYYEYFDKCDPQLVKITYEMLDLNPFKRITVEDALKKSIFAEFHSPDLIEHQFCTKIIIPQVDDNIKLGVAKYRQAIYKEIQRRYTPQEVYTSINTTIKKSIHKTKAHSLQPKKFVSQKKTNLKRQKSTLSFFVSTNCNKNQQIKTNAKQVLIQNVEQKNQLCLENPKKKVVNFLKKTKSKAKLINNVQNIKSKGVIKVRFVKKV